MFPAFPLFVLCVSPLAVIEGLFALCNASDAGCHSFCLFCSRFSPLFVVGFPPQNMSFLTVITQLIALAASSPNVVCLLAFLLFGRVRYNIAHMWSFVSLLPVTSLIS